MSENTFAPISVRREISREYRIARSVWTTLAAMVFGLTYTIMILFALDGLGVFRSVGAAFGVELRAPMFAPLETSPAYFIAGAYVAELLLDLIEFIAAKRTERRGSTLPLIALPGGRLLRFVLLLPIWLIVVVPKLMCYFTILSLRLIIPFTARWPRVQNAIDGLGLGLVPGLLHAGILSIFVVLRIVPPDLAGYLLLSAALWPTFGLIWGAVRAQSTTTIIDIVDATFEPLDDLASRFYNAIFYTKIHPGGGAFSTLFNASTAMWCLNQ